MKQSIKAFTPAPIRSFLARLGRFYAHGDLQDPFPSQEGAFQTLKRLGWFPSHCIDVGAFHGDWARMFLSIFPDSKVLMFEGQQSKEVFLRVAVEREPHRLAYQIGLLGATDGTEVEFVEMETGSSVFEESSHYPRTKRKVKLLTLDHALAAHQEFERAQILKLDTQGYELEVMKGASHLLKTVQVILLEVSLICINRGAPKFSEVIAFMTEHDFLLFDFCSQIRRRDGVLWQTDLLFIRNGTLPNLKTSLTVENWG